MIASSSTYLDHAAATPVDERVLEAMLPYFTELFYNPSSPYAPAVRVRKDIDRARHQIAQCIGAKPADIIITAGATESINIAMSAADDGRIITSAIEHQAVLESAQTRDSIVIDVDSSGIVDYSDIERSITPETQLISIAIANNELGTIQPIRRTSELVRTERNRRKLAGESRPIWLHCDASQGVGQIDVNVARLGLDLLTLNAGKCYGPKQVGLLWRASGVTLRPLIYGGGQETNIRSGTENVPGIIGFAKALELSTQSRHQESKRLAILRDGLQRKLIAEIPGLVLNGHQKKRLPGHLHISLPGIDAERIVFLLESRGIYVATGSACAANSGTRSHVLEAIGLDPQCADGSLRLTLGRQNSESSVNNAAKEIIEAVKIEKIRVKA